MTNNELADRLEQRGVINLHHESDMEAFRAIINALRSSYVQREPKRMEFAPKDGSPILAFVPSYYQGKGAWVVVLWLRDGWYDNRAWKTAPRVWLPLPDLLECEPQ